MCRYDICGYQSSLAPQGYSFRTVTFKEVGSSDTEKAYDLLDIAVLQESGAEWPASPAGLNNNLIVQKIGTDGAYGTQYLYSSTKSGGVVIGWHLNGGKSIKRGDCVLKKGEGLIIFFNKKNGGTPVANCQLRFAGEVELTDTSFLIPQGYSFSGNNTPVSVDLTEIQVKQLDGTDWPASPAGLNNNLILQKIGTDGAYGTQYLYSSTKSGGVVIGWHLNDGTKIASGNVTFEPGEGFIAFFNKKNGGKPVASCQLVMPKAIEK